MKIDWDSSSNEILLNPRLPEEKRKRYADRLNRCVGLKGHVWVTTSGTTGKFKFVALSKEGILCSAKAVNSHLESDSSDVWLHVLPDFHVGGLGIWARSHLSGASVFKQTSWNAETFCSFAAEAKGTLTALVPTQIYDLVEKQLHAPSTLRATVVGGGALTRRLYREAEKLGWYLLPSYGLTECASQVATAVHGQYDEAQILSHVELKITSEGFISIKSPSLFSTYADLDGDELRLYDPKENGWFVTEDKGQVEGKTLKVFGRQSDFVKIGGESVNLLHLQKVVDELKLDHCVEHDVVVHAAPDGRLGHVIHFVVEGKQCELIDKLVEKYQKKVMPYERVKKIHFEKTIPRNELGKKVLFLL